MKTNRVVAAATFGVIGVLTLGACSSNASDQAQDARPSQASSSPAEREAAKPDNSKNVALPASKGGKFSNVVTTHAPQTKCTRTEKKDEDGIDALYVECTNVVFSVMGDSVFVRVPGKDYKVYVFNDSKRDFLDMSTVQRDYASSAVTKPLVVDVWKWTAPGRSTDTKGWAVGADSNQIEPIKVTMIVYKTK